MQPPSAAEAARSVRLRPIALPVEHGSWGLVAEPIALGLLVAPSMAGACLALGAFATFLIRRPLKVVLAQRGHKWNERTTIATTFAALYGIVAAGGIAAAVALRGVAPLAPLALVIPLAAVFLAYDLRNQSRTWQAELAGAVAFAAVTASIAIADGWSLAAALALAGVLAARNFSSVIYVRSRIRLDRNKPHSTALVWAVHVAGLALLVGLAGSVLLPWLAVLPFVVLLARALHGLSRFRRPMSVRAIGFREMAYGILTVLAVAVGHWMEAM